MKPKVWISAFFPGSAFAVSDLEREAARAAPAGPRAWLSRNARHRMLLRPEPGLVRFVVVPEPPGGESGEEHGA